MAKKYKKDITVTYRYAKTPESEQVLEQVFDKIFSHIIQRQKQLKEYFNSNAFKEDYKRLQKRKSILVDSLSVH